MTISSVFLNTPESPPYLRTEISLIVINIILKKSKAFKLIENPLYKFFIKYTINRSFKD